MKKEMHIEDVQNKINDMNLKFQIIEYKKNGKKSKFKHECGHIFETKLSHLLARKKCPICDGKWRTKEMFQLESDKIHNNEYQILYFENGNKPVKIKHMICGHIFEQIGNRHLRGDRCFNCYGTKKLSKRDIIEKSLEIWNKEYEFLSDKVEYSKKTIFRHKTCGYVYEQIVSSHLFGHGCPKCAGNAPLTKIIVQEKSNKIHNFEYEILSNPSGSFSKIEIKHKSCGRIFLQTVSDHFSGCGCSFCNQSKYETHIERILDEFNIQYSKQKTFSDCKYKNKLKFDFYLTEKNICIEFDGIQHFKPIRFFGGKKAFELQKIKDKIKNDFCENNKIKIIRFNYNDDLEYIKNEICKLNH